MKKIIPFVIVLLIVGLSIVAFTIFFDQAVLMRKGTIYKINEPYKIVALTFDDGPSLDWTPKILDELKKAGVKATFFMLGRHVAKYPDLARRVAKEGHEIGNHTYDHHVLLYYTPAELEKEIKDTEKIIKLTTGLTTKYFRPPKALLTSAEKKKIKELGYKIVLWTLNSKDWVNFDDKYIVRYLVKNIHPGDIILFHDSGGVFGTEGGNRNETVKTISKLVDELKIKGYRFATISELLKISEHDVKSKNF